jgi:Ca2+-binding RTX toxin-like protein
VGSNTYGQAGHTDVNLADVAAGTGGLRITGTNLAGMTVLGNVDLNRDGIEDLVIGTPHDAEGGTDAGAVYVVWGDQLYRPINLAEVAQGIGGAKIVGSAGSLTGSAIAVAGDQNGDGTADLAILSPGTGESLRILYTPATWGPDANVYGTSGADLLGEGYGGPLHAIGAGNDSVLGLGGNDTIETGAGNDTIEGGLGVDSLIGGTGDDTYVVDTIGDVVVEAAGEGIDTLRTALNASLGANVENLILTGLAENGFGNELDNQITGNVVANWLVGGAGNDTMTGGQGNDAYSVDSAGDVVVEATGGGTDTVRSTIDYTLGLNLENLILEGTALRGTGNGGLNAITGTAGNNVLDGGAGMDSLRGLGGDDAYYVDNALDQVFENAGEGNDTVYASADFTLRGWVETLVMTAPGHRGTGSDIDNTLIGSTGQDTLDGGVGNDLLQGGRGNDSYVVDSLGDQTVELAGGGRDTVTAALDWTLALNVEDLVLIGAAHSGTGNALGNRITGTALADTLNGAAGADTLIGGDGDDIYRVDNLRDTVVETAGGGNDSVISSVSHTLADGVETLTLTRGRLTGTGNAADNLLNGSTGADHLLGLAGDDTLDGGAGADTMEGGAGNDIYLIDNAGDLIIEGADGGIDVAIVTRAGIVVNGDVEIIRLGGTVHSLTGGTGDNTLEGSGGGDTLDGGAGNDHILAGAGDDVIEATSGHDTLSGGEGDDLYHVHGAAVEIEDFLGDDTLDGSDSASNDYIDLSGETECEIEHEIVHITPGGTTSGPLDVQFLQDLTGSFADDIATVRGLVPQLVAAIQAVQANAEFGVSSFVDKPISPFGATGEWVYEQELGLTADATALAGTYNGLTTLNGADSPESQLEALMQLALHAADVGFRADSARFVVLFTDAPFHVAGDGTAAGITTPNNGDAVIDGGGLGEDYPLIAQVAAALAAANIIPIFAIAGGFEATYQGLVTDLGRGAVVSLTMNSSNIVDAITAGMIAVTTTRIEDAISGSGDDTILGGVEDNELTGNAGGDRLEGRAGADVLVGGSGNDLLDGGAGNDTLSGGAGDDRAVFTGAMADYALAVTAAGVTVTDLRAGSPDGTDVLTGIETLAFSDGDQALAALLGAVVLDTLTTGADVLTVADTDNHLIHGGNGNDVLTGGQGFDTIFGDAGNDVLSGGLGDDRLVGGALADTLTGGAGADTFVFDLATDSSRSRPDLITDFTSGLDLVDLTAIDADALTAGDQAFAFIGSAAFGMHAGEMRLVTSTTGVARLMGDVNGDGVADLSISFNLTTGAAPALADMLL